MATPTGLTGSADRLLTVTPDLSISTLMASQGGASLWFFLGQTLVGHGGDAGHDGLWANFALVMLLWLGGKRLAQGRQTALIHRGPWSLIAVDRWLELAQQSLQQLSTG